MVKEIIRDYKTQYAKFSFTDWAADENLLPTTTRGGNGDAKKYKSCISGSLAIGIDGSVKILNGDTDRWTDYQRSSGGGGEDYNIATKEDIDNLF